MTDDTKTPPSDRRNRPPSVAFCSEHGRLDKVDEDGLCPSCGATSMGDAIDELLHEFAQLRAERDRLREALVAQKNHLSCWCDEGWLEIHLAEADDDHCKECMQARAVLSVEVKTK